MVSVNPSNCIIVAIVVISLTLSFLIFPISSKEKLSDKISWVLGWTYFTCWSISFYPQVFLNYRRKSVIGLSFDFLILNLLGYICYSIFNCSFYFSKNITSSPSSKHVDSSKQDSVQANDVFFSLHGLLLTLVTCIQCLIYEKGKQTISYQTKSIVVTSLALGIVFLILVAVCSGLQPRNGRNIFSIGHFLYFTGYVKLFVTVIKYIPQARLNYIRKSTTGWNIWNVLLDFSGGMLSLVQIILIAFSRSHWNLILENPVKLGLGLISIFFDVLFIIQHYILYPQKSTLHVPANLEKYGVDKKNDFDSKDQLQSLI